MKINRAKILKYVEFQYPYIDDVEKVMLAESMLNYFRNNIKKSYEKLKKVDRLMRMQDEEDDGLNLASEGIRRMSKPQEDPLAALVRDKLEHGKFHLNLSEDVNPKYSKLLRFLLSSNDPKIRNYAKAIYINTMRSPERQRRAADMELKRLGISDLGDIIQNPQKYGIRANNVTGVFDSGKPNKQYSENIKRYKLKKVK